jgi:hypothetical protein
MRISGLCKTLNIFNVVKYVQLLWTLVWLGQGDKELKCWWDNMLEDSHLEARESDCETIITNLGKLGHVSSSVRYPLYAGFFARL